MLNRIRSLEFVELDRQFDGKILVSFCVSSRWRAESRENKRPLCGAEAESERNRKFRPDIYEEA